VPTYTTSILSTASLWAQGFAAKDAGGFDARLGNSLRYDSPSFNGLTFSGQIALKDTSGGTATGDGTAEQQARHAYVWGVNTIYNNGPIQVGAAYESNQKVRGEDLSDYDFTITGGYNFGVIRVAGLYEKLKYDTPTGDLKRDMWGISGTIPMGPGTWYLFYGWAGDGKGSTCDINEIGCNAANGRVAGLARGSNTGSQQWEVSYTYPFSKRTAVYAGYVELHNDSQALYTFNINSYAIAPGGKPQGIVLGMIHLF
jgi:predicted porin